MNSEDGPRRSASILNWRNQSAVRFDPWTAIEGVIERHVDVCLLVERIARVLHIVDRPLIVNPRRARSATYRRDVANRVGAVSADHPHRDAAAHVTIDDGLIIATVKIDANLLRFTRIESPRKIWSVVSRLENDIDNSITDAHDVELIVGIGSVNIGDSPQLRVVSIRN